LRSESSDSLLNQIFQRKYSSSLAQWNLEKWLEELLPNTRLIIEPKIFDVELLCLIKIAHCKKLWRVKVKWRSINLTS